MESQDYTPPEAKQSLYKERISSNEYLSVMLEEIDKLTRGEGVLDLSEVERKHLYEYEAELEQELFKIWEPKVRTMDFDLNYLQTEEGRNSFIEKTGLEDLPQQPDELIAFLYANANKISEVPSNTRKELSGESKNYRDNKLFEAATVSLKEDGTLGGFDLEYSEMLSVIFDTDKLLKKSKLLREFKQKLKKEYQALDGDESDAAEAKRLVLNLYAHRVNDLIVNIFPERRKIAKKANSQGIESLTPVERELLGDYSQDEIDTGQARFITDVEFRESQAAKLDKYKNGASQEISDGQRKQIGAELEQLAKELGEKWATCIVERRKIMETLGLDVEKLLEKNVSAQKRKEIVEGHFSRLGILSSVAEYDPDREGPAEDDKFQAYIKPGAKSAAVNSKTRVQIISESDSDIINTLTVDGTHEVAHALQVINSSGIPLRIFDRVGGGGSSAFSEGGAMYAEMQATKALFGYEGANHPHYIKAMSARLKGATYPETVAVFYNSEMEPYIELRSKGEISEEEFESKKESALKIALNRCQRIFSGSRLGAEGSFITSSRSTVYLEQNVVLDQLKKRGLEKIFFLRSMSLENIVTLMKLGCLNLDEVKEPDYDYIKEIWENVKEGYLK